MRHVDVAILGAGTAGLSARREVAKVTDNYVVLDDGELGTTCARVGCMPSKALIQVANDFHRRHVLPEFGISGGHQLTADPAKVMEHVRSLRDYYVGFVKDGIGSWAEGHLIQRRARFLNENTVDLGGEQIRANKIIIATGSSPVWPGPWRQHSQYLLDTDQFFEQTTLPERVAVVGLGVIGIELGQALARLGVNVVGISLDKAIGGLSDPDLQCYAAKTFWQEMNTIYAPAEMVGPNDKGFIVTAADHRFEVDKVLLTLGRTPNVSQLGLEAIGVPIERGIPRYNKDTLRIDGTDIYIAGDANGERNLLHEAADEGRMAGFNAARDEDHRFRRRLLLAVTFTEPNLAFVGQTHGDLTRDGADFIIGSVSYEDQGRATVMRRNKGRVHIYAERKTGKVLGAEMVAPGAEHFAHLLSWIITMKLRVQDVLAMPFYHPVLEEGLRTAFRDAASKTELKSSDIELIRCVEPPVGGCQNAAA